MKAILFVDANFRCSSKLPVIVGSLFSWLHWHYTNYDTFTVVQNYAYDTRDNVEVDGLSKWVEAIKFISRL